MLRIETKSRARALQLLYAWELRGNAPVTQLATGLSRLTGPEPRVLDRAEALASGVVEAVDSLDSEAAQASENWRLSRMAVVERNILRLGILQLRRGGGGPPGATPEGGGGGPLVGGGPGAPGGP